MKSIEILRVQTGIYTGGNFKHTITLYTEVYTPNTKPTIGRAVYVELRKDKNMRKQIHLAIRETTRELKKRLKEIEFVL